MTTIRLPRVNVWMIWWGRSIGRISPDSVPDVTYAWGGEALSLAVRQRAAHAFVGAVTDPKEVPEIALTCRVLECREAIGVLACSSGHVRELLLTEELPEELIEMVPPAVDLEALRAVDRSRVRRELDLSADDRVLVTPSPPSRAGGQYEAVWATAVLHQIWPNVRLIVPGSFEKAEHVRRIAERCYCPEIFRLPRDRYSPAELLVAGDLLVVPAVESIPAGWLPWAMAAGVPIVATAVPTATELIEDGKTGFLAKSPRPHDLATRIRQVWEDVEARKRCVTAARDQAHGRFRLRRFVDAHLKLIDELVEEEQAVCRAERRAGKLATRLRRELDS